ncbi:MAG: tetratricopeptide repeat protein [Deltaproteobacteria bacterium]|nr:tetratricopeptide repeat protein [Deltaproteobacteria bacterium]
MIKGVWFFAFLSLFLLLQSTASPSTRIILDGEDQFGFAEQAVESGDYLRAVGEFERFIYFFPDHVKVPQARLQIGICYLKAGDFEAARKVLDKLHRKYPENVLGGKALLLMGESYYRQGFYKEAEYHYGKVAETYPQPELKNNAIYRLGWCRMHTGSWRAASDTFGTVGPESFLYPASQDLIQKSLHGEMLPYKDPTKAGVLAAVLPGMGHAYCNRYRDALVSFLINGLFIWAALESFNNDREVLGSILVFAELGWYSGNIYSAVNSTHKYNRKLKEDFLRNLPDSLNLHLLATREGHLGLTLRLSF